MRCCGLLVVQLKTTKLAVSNTAIYLLTLAYMMMRMGNGKVTPNVYACVWALAGRDSGPLG